MPLPITFGSASSRGFGFAGAAPVPTDPYFEYVTGLFHFDGTNGAQNNTFLDSSANNYTVTRNGNTTQGSFAPFSRQNGWWSNYFGNSGYISLGSNAALQPGSGDFTAEAWFNASALNTGTGGYNAIFSYGAGSGNLRLFLNGTTPNVTVWDGASLFGNYSSSIKVNEWNHIAIVRSGSTITTYLNGSSLGTATVTTNFTGTLNIASESGSYLWNGYISNFRLVKGTAVYTSAFTPPTSPLTAITNTGALTCQSNQFVDNSANNFAVTVTATSSIQAFNPFNPTSAYSAGANGGSGYFDGTGDYLTYSTPATNVRNWWDGDWTCEAWIYPTSFTGWDYDAGGGNRVPTLIGNADPSSTTDYWSFGPLNTGGVRLYYFNGAAVYPAASTATVKLNQWNHIAFTKTSSGITYFVNGVGESPIAISGTPQSSNTQPLTIGRINNTAINGFVSGMRIVYGTALYSGSTYTVPTAPPTAVANTSFLLNYTNGAIFDNSSLCIGETLNQAQISTSVTKFGSGSMVCDGSGDGLLVASSSPNFGFGTGDFTIEGWFYINSAVTARQPFIKIGTGATSVLQVLKTDGGFSYALGYLINSGSGIGSFAGFVPATATWNHIAVSRQGTSMRFFLNGALAGTVTGSDNLGTSNGLVIGYDENFFIGNRSLDGYADEVRITKGYARYTAAFTPPTAPFPNL